MLFKQFSVLAAATFIFSATAMAAATPNTNNVRAILIAPNPDDACRCPNNCSHHEGDSCKYCSDPNQTCDTVDGTCQQGDGGLTCIPN